MAWAFNPEYWACRERRDWSVCPDLFSMDESLPVPPAHEGEG